MFVCCECCVLSGRGLCYEPITRPEESYRLWCVVVCDLENFMNEEAMARVGPRRQKKKFCLTQRYISNAFNATVLNYWINKAMHVPEPMSNNASLIWKVPGSNFYS